MQWLLCRSRRGFALTVPVTRRHFSLLMPQGTAAARCGGASGNRGAAGDERYWCIGSVPGEWQQALRGHFCFSLCFSAGRRHGILGMTIWDLWRITIVDKAVIYIHGKGGNAEEAIHYKPLFSNCDVIGLDYTAQFPWEAKEEFPLLFNSIYRNYKTVEVIANSIGAYFAINALSNQQIEKAYFISPVVDMERLIADMMIWANVTEDELKEKKEIQTTFGETLSWDYLCYARENPIIWEIPTHILYGEKDNLTAYGTIFEFVQRTNSTLSIMKNGEHWFHTDEQMKFLDEWIIKSSK